MPSSLAITGQPQTPPPAPRGVRWIDVATAAGRMGKDERTVRRDCAADWFPLGLARQQQPAGGRGKLQWFVREDADPRLARVVRPEHLGDDLSAYPEAKRKVARLRAAVLEAWSDHLQRPDVVGLTRAQADARFLRFLADGVAAVRLPPGMRSPTDRTLRNWRAAYANDGLAGLVDDRGGRRTPDAGDAFFDDVKGRWLDQRKPGLVRCWELACERAKATGWDTKTLKQTRLFIGRIPPAVVIEYRGGKKAFDDHAGAHITRDYSTLRSNELWVADHHQFDVMVAHQGRRVRPWLSCFMDMRSRKVVGWTITPGSPNTDTILAALRAGIDSHGVPEGAYTDNGKDYQSAALRGTTKRQRQRRAAGPDVNPDDVAGAFASLRIAVTNAMPYNAKAKPVERFFGTLEERFGKSQPTYCGRSPAERPENLQAKLDRGAAPDLDDFTAEFTAWLDGDYHHRPHGGDSMDGRTPSEVFDAHMVERRAARAEVVRVLLWRGSRPTRVTKNGVRVHGLSYGAMADELFPWIGRDVIVRVDPGDMNRAAVCQLTGEFICMVAANVRLPAKASPEELRVAMAKNRHRNKLSRQFHDAWPQMHRDVSADMYAARAEAAAARERAAHPLPPPPVVPVVTPLDGAFPQLERAVNGPRPTTAANAPAPCYPSLSEMMAEKERRDVEERERADAEVGSTNMSFRQMMAVAAFGSKRAVGDE